MPDDGHSDFNFPRLKQVGDGPELGGLVALGCAAPRQGFLRRVVSSQDGDKSPTTLGWRKKREVG